MRRAPATSRSSCFSSRWPRELGLPARPELIGPGRRKRAQAAVLEVREPSLLRFSWVGDEHGKATYVTYRIEPQDGGTRFTYEHAGFTGAAGFFLAKLLGAVRKKMLVTGLPAVLDDLDENGVPRGGSALRS
jgi:uncharacterized protein YndB with AHSA1/START domain